jgi:hypothetical protein
MGDWYATETHAQSIFYFLKLHTSVTVLAGRTV